MSQWVGDQLASQAVRLLSDWIERPLLPLSNRRSRNIGASLLSIGAKLRTSI